MRDLNEELEAAKRAAATREFNKNKVEASSTVNRVLFEAKGIKNFLWQFVVVIFWIWKNLLWPFSVWFSPLAVWAFNKYRRAWTNYTIQPDKYGVLRFKKMRGVGMVLGTVFAAFFAFHAAFFALDASIWAATKKQGELIYLYRSEDSFAGNGVYSVSGCEITNPELKARIEASFDNGIEAIKDVDLACEDVDGLYFRLSFSPFDWFYRLVTKGQLFYYPDLIHSSIATNWNVCISDNYGYRWRWMMGLGIEEFYPKILSTQCHSISQ